MNASVDALRNCVLSMTLLACISMSHATEAERILRLVDETEVIHLTNIPETRGKQRYQVVVDSSVTGAADADDENQNGAQTKAASAPLLPSPEIQKIVGQAARKHRVEPELVYAVMGTESAFASRAVSYKGAKGLMQLMPATASRYGVTNPFDAQQNIDAGTWHLRTLLDEFNDNKTLALAAYNAGSAAVLRYQKQIPPYSETQAYVPKVLRRYQVLRAFQLVMQDRHSLILSTNRE